MQDLSIIQFMILVFAAFRLTRLVVYDGITNFIRRPFTGPSNHVGVTAAIRSWLGGLLNCHWCFGFWASVIIYVLYVEVPIVYPLIIVLAIAGAAAILQAIVKSLNPQEYL